ncbi:hypothetical protein CALCODRAFT_513632, partial [Calocera cornea HHB12733]
QFDTLFDNVRVSLREMIEHVQAEPKTHMLLNVLSCPAECLGPAHGRHDNETLSGYRDLDMGGKIWDITSHFTSHVSSDTPKSLNKWRLIATRGAYTLRHMDYAGLSVITGVTGGAPSPPHCLPKCERGGKLWWFYSDNVLHKLKSNYFPQDAIDDVLAGGDVKLWGVHLVYADLWIQRANTLHGVFTTAHTTCEGGNFFCATQVKDTYLGAIVQSKCGNVLTNADDARVELVPERIIMLIHAMLEAHSEMRDLKFWEGKDRPDLLKEGIMQWIPYPKTNLMAILALNLDATRLRCGPLFTQEEWEKTMAYKDGLERPFPELVAQFMSLEASEDRQTQRKRAKWCTMKVVLTLWETLEEFKLDLAATVPLSWSLRSMWKPDE